MRKWKQRGATTIEMTLVGIPMIFILISVFEMSRGMWNYHTLSYAVKNGVRFAIVHGVNCVPATGTFNSCTTTIAGVAGRIQNDTVGIVPNSTQLTFTPGAVGAAATSCYMGSSSGSAVAGPYGSLLGCLSLTDIWPPDDGNGTNNGVGKLVRIDVRTPFQSPLSMFWPGTKPVNFAVIHFGASSVDRIQF